MPGVPLHVIQRGNNRGLCFHAGTDRQLYIRCLIDASVRHQCAIHAYVLMPNHVHLLVTPAAVGGVAAMMQDVGRRYVRLFNRSHERTGTLWEGRYKSSLIDTYTYLLTCHRYIELNPVRAGLAEHPLDYPWSSHAHYALGIHNPLIRRHAMFDQLADHESARRSIFLAQFRSTMQVEDIERIRVAANRGWALGSERFLDEIAVVVGRSARPPKRGRPYKADYCPGPAGQQSEMFI